MDALIDELLKGFGVVLVGMVMWLVQRLLQRMGIELDIKRQQQLESMARQAVAQVEELAAEHAKTALREWSGPEKLSAAVTTIVDKLPRVDREEATAIVQAVLPSMGIGAAAGAVELGKALRTQ